MSSVNLTNSSYLHELYQAIECFKKDNKKEGLNHFELFCKFADQQAGIKDAACKIYRRIWKAMGQPMPHSHPQLAHDDYGRVAFHELEGRVAPNAIKSQVLESFFIHIVKKKLKEIGGAFRYDGYDESPLREFKNLFEESSQIPLLKDVENLVYNKTWARMGKPTETHLSSIAHPDFGRVAFHNMEMRSTTSQEKADAVYSCIVELACRKFWNGLYQQADNYFKRNAQIIRPADTHDLPRIPTDEEVVLRKLFEKYQGVCFGDTHGDVFSIEFLYQHLGFLRQLGVKTLFMELFNYELQPSLDAFNRTGEVSTELRKQCGTADMNFPRTANGISHLTFIRAARDFGIRLVGIDTKSARFMMEKDWQDGGRIDEMNYVAKRIMDWENKNDKFVVWMGAGHLTNVNVRETIKFPSRSEMKEIISDIGGFYPLLEQDEEQKLEEIIEYSIHVLAIQIFHNSEYRTCEHHFGLNKSVYSLSKYTIDNFIEILKSKIQVVRKETTIPGVSELIQCPSIRMASQKNADFLAHHKHNYPYFVCFNEQKTFGIASLSDPNFEFLEKPKVAVAEKSLIASIDQAIEDKALETIWPQIAKQFYVLHPAIALDPRLSAPQIRLWMARNQQLLQGVTQLYLTGCDLHVLPKEIGLLTGLQKLYAYANNIQTLPAEIGNLISLQELNLGSNQLKALPATIGNLVFLRELDLSNNLFTVLPAEIGDLTSLIILKVASNQLTALPAEIWDLPNLFALYQTNNPFTVLARLSHLSRRCFQRFLMR